MAVMLTLDQKQRVRSLRSEGLTYTEIQQELGNQVPKSSLSYICRDIKMNSAYYTKIKLLNRSHLQKAGALAVEHNKRLRQLNLDAIEAVSKGIVSKATSNESLKLALAMLYLGEGSKWSCYRGLRLGNSNPDIVQLYIALLGKCYGIPVNRLRARVQCRADQDIKSLEYYWSDITGIALNRFYKTGVDQRTIGKPTMKRDYRGVCVIICRGTQVQLELAYIAKSLLYDVGL